MVPGGTVITASLTTGAGLVGSRRACRVSARISRWLWMWSRVLRFRCTRSTTLPPRPPSPPLGPPLGTNFSRRKETQPLPPSPASTVIRAWSTSMIIDTKARRSF